MSSYELLELLEFMPDNGAFKTALRGGEYSEDQITWRHISNELARLRATMHAVYGGQRYEPPLLLTKAEQRDEMTQLEETAERREDFFSLADRTPMKLADDDADMDLVVRDWNGNDRVGV
jgi:hypothetical protein